jgi:transketolase
MAINKDLRVKILKMIYNSKEGHLPSAFSIIDIINNIYSYHLRNIKKKKITKRDIFILSKGHGAAALYAVLNKFNFISKTIINNYAKKDSILGGHPDSTKIEGVDFSTGSLGHGFPAAVGLAAALKILNSNYKVYCLIGDGECNEGTIWESALIASNLKLDNLCCIIDNNKSSQEILPLPNLQKQFQSFGWYSINCDGHINKSLNKSINIFKKNKIKPTVIVAKTTKGKGVRFIENNPIWHHKIPTSEEFNLCLKELNK